MTEAEADLGGTPRTRVRRGPKKAVTDRSRLYALLDRNYVCHLAFTTSHGPAVVPMVYGRRGDELYVHGSKASRALTAGDEVCIAVTESTGLVLAQAVFLHTMNYESAIVFGHAEVVDEAETLGALKIISDHMLEGRWEDARPPNARELAQTRVLRVPLHEASMKARAGPPSDDPDDSEDMWSGTWTGVVPIHTTRGRPEPDEKSAEQKPPEYLE